MKRRTALQHLTHSPMGWLALSLGSAELARGATVMAVRVWPADAYTRVAIESDVPLNAHHFVTPEPYRLVVDLQDQDLTPELRELVGKIKPDDPYIAGVRIGQNQPNVVRMVVDLKQPIKPQQFSLLPAGNYKHRLVFDLYPAEERDPLHTLLDEKLKAESAASQSINDVMSQLMTQLDRQSATARSSVSSSRASQAGQDGTDADPLAQFSKPSQQPTRSQKERLNRLIIVALDPGHGGEDPGASGPSGLHEKDVVLNIALQLRKLINAKPGMRAMMTRDSDFYVPLQERVAKARKVKADLFISIHADAFARPEAHGASVFALSASGASSTTARFLADKENAADVIGGVNVAVKDNQVMRAMLEMSTSAQIKDSMRIGSEVLGHIGKVGDLHKAKVEQAGFAVLKAPDIPSILVETAFISNPAEERKLRSPAYQRKLVEALFAGIERYFAKKPPLSRRRTA